MKSIFNLYILFVLLFLCSIADGQKSLVNPSTSSKPSSIVKNLYGTKIPIPADAGNLGGLLPGDRGPWLLDSIYGYNWNNGNWTPYSHNYRFKNTYGWTIQSLYKKFNQSANQFLDYARYLYSYTDSIPDVTSDTGQFWYSNAWLTYQYTHFKIKNFVDETYLKNWTNSQHKFTSGFRDLYQYNDSMLVIQSVTQSYDTSTTHWLNTVKDTITYTSLEQPSETITFTWQNATSSWMTSYKTSDVYDLNNLLVSHLEYSWNDSSNVWDIALRYSYFNNPAGNLDSLILESWNKNYHRWDTIQRTQNIYDSQNKLWSSIIQRKDLITGLWINNFMYDYTYYPGEVLLDFTNYFWDDIDLRWKETDYQKYDLTGKLLEDWHKALNLSTFLYTGGNSTLYTYDANEDTLAKVYQQWDVSAGKWVNNLQDVYTYDSHNMVSQDLTQTFRVSDSTWVNSKKSDYYYSEFTGIGEHKKGEKLCFYANPMTTGATINCPALTPGNDYLLRICSTSGREVYRSSFHGGNSVRIPESLSPGLYFLILEEKSIILYKDKIILLR